jgi:hypothetical protein
MGDEQLGSWREGRAKDAIVDFVRTVSTDGPTFVPPQERIATFDNDGTLWCEKPMPIQLDFVLRRFAAMVDDAPELKDRQPWKATVERDHGWFEALVDAHYAGDDTGVKVLLSGLLAAYDGMSIDDFEASSDAFLRSTQHPTQRLDRRLLTDPNHPAMCIHDAPRVARLDERGRTCAPTRSPRNGRAGAPDERVGVGRDRCRSSDPVDGAGLPVPAARRRRPSDRHGASQASPTGVLTRSDTHPSFAGGGGGRVGTGRWGRRPGCAGGPAARSRLAS